MIVLFLYTELADYFLKCCDELSKTAEVHIVRWPVNKEAPFNFSFSDKIKIYDKKDLAGERLQQFIANLKPDVLVCSGWVDKDYLKAAKPWFKKIPTVMTCDTHWTGSLKQYAALVLSRFFLLNTFSHAWVPGAAQRNYALKLGFKAGNIANHFYCCDLAKFNAIHERLKPIREKEYPKRFLYVGRYYDFKGITDLWDAFIQLQQEQPNDWELWCLGTGSLTPAAHPKIKHFGFVQPSELEPVIEKTGVFLLPSRFEPWGVVVQEYAAAGFPLLLSREVGAKEAFLEESKNGHLFAAGNVADLKKQLKKILDLDTKDLLLMSEKSHALAQKISPQNWVAQIQNIYERSHKK